MKLKKIPDDIKTKTIKEAQSEIKEIVLELESAQTSLENSTEKYNRMMLLNYHIQEQFRIKAREIKRSILKKPKKKSTKVKK
tara:strand:- start:1943 stop:2188 length:246 start_codon:yes stop_codon:yes gene_type:complete